MQGDVVIVLGVEEVLVPGPVVDGRLGDATASDEVIRRVRRLTDSAQVILATDTRDADQLDRLAKALDIPDSLVLNRTGPPPQLRAQYPTARSWRIGKLLRLVGTPSGAADWSGLVCIDAHIGPNVDRWKEEFDFPVLVVPVDPIVGLAGTDLHRVDGFLRAVKEAGPPDAGQRDEPNDKMLLELGFEFLSYAERRALVEEAQELFSWRLELAAALSPEESEEFEALLAAGPEELTTWLAEHDPDSVSSDLLGAAFATEAGHGRSLSPIEPAYVRNRWLQMHAPDLGASYTRQLLRIRADLEALRDRLLADSRFALGG